MPLITVLMPVRDGVETLPGALSSTLSALPRDAEIAVLDDASTQDVGGILHAWREAPIRYFRSDVPLGVGGSLHYLTERTDREYVFRMDSDDIVLPGRFVLQLRQLRAGMDIVFSPIVAFSAAPRRVRPGLPLPITPEAMPLHLLIHNPLCHPTMAARRAAVERAGGWRALRAEDHDLWLRALARGLRLARGSLPVLAYRHHAGQLSAQADFIKTSFAELDLRESYMEFVRHRFHVEATWLSRLWEADGDSSELEPLRELVAREGRALGPLQRLVLTRTTRLLEGR